MPTYQYACTECDNRFEQVQAFSDASLTVCPVCGGKLRKVYGSVGVVFKGSGFYRTDSRAGAVSAVSGGDKSESSASTDSGKTPAKESAGSTAKSGDSGSSSTSSSASNGSGSSSSGSGSGSSSSSSSSSNGSGSNGWSGNGSASSKTAKSTAPAKSK